MTKKHTYLLITLCCMIAYCFMGCSTKSKINDPKNQHFQKEVDYSIYDFSEVRWTREAECDRETLCFFANGEFLYSCACGNSVNDSDVVEHYSYDDATKLFSLHCYEEIEGMITEITLIRCDGETLELDFGGEKRVFYIEGTKGDVNATIDLTLLESSQCLI